MQVLVTRAWRTVCGLVLFGLSAALQAAAQPIAFQDASETAGLAGRSTFGVAVADFDGDGWDDAFLTTSNGPSLLMRNNGDGTFSDVAQAAGITASGNHGVALWADLNGDARPDLFMGHRGTGENRLYLNNGDGTFSDATAVSGLAVAAEVGSAAFGDYDGDGRLDLFLAVDRGPDLLFQNTSEGGRLYFTDVSAAAGIAGIAGSVAMQSTWFDYNHDGRLDLFCVHDGTTESRLHQNNGFLPLSDVARTARIADVGAGNSMGTAWFDFDGDGWEDAYVTRIGHGGLYRNNGDGTFTDVAVERGIDRNGMAWGVVPADFDNDGDQDVFIVNTSGFDGTPSLLYRNDDSFFTEIGAAAGAAFHLDAYGAATGDFNRDGRPDLLLAASGNTRLLLNTTPTDGHHVTLRLQGTTVNPSAVGIRVEIRAGGRTLVRSVSGGDSFCSQSSPTLHVGLGAATQIDTLRIFWSRDQVEERTALPVDTAFAFVEPARVTAVESAFPGEAFALGAAYPNPTTGPVTLPFTLDRPAFVALTVYDLLGREVGVPLRERLAPGSYAVPVATGTWPDGVYFYRLSTGTTRQTRAFILRR